MGVGSDIGGSVRIPSLYNGIYGIKATAKRFTNKGFRFFDHIDPGPQFVRSTVGPLAKSVDDLVLFYKSMLQPKQWLKD
jgi:amidase